MDIDDIRKRIFLDSQFFSYYTINNTTILAGIMRNNGYLYNEKFSEDKLKQVSKDYRHYVAMVNIALVVEILIFLYLFLFPFYLKLLTMPFFTTTMVLITIPLVALYLNYVVVNRLYEKYLIKNFGAYKKTKFKPSVKNVSDSAFLDYLSTPRKSVYVLALLIVLFVSYILTPLGIKTLNTFENYKLATTLSNVYLKFIPINSEVYANKAYAEYKEKNYKKAIDDYDKANKYSFSDSFSGAILGLKTQILSYEEMIEAFDKAIFIEVDEDTKNFYKSEKAIYMFNNKKYKESYHIFDELVQNYEQKEQTKFKPEEMYYARGVIKGMMNDIKGANFDKNIAHKMCPECSFEFKSHLIHKL